MHGFSTLRKSIHVSVLMMTINPNVSGPRALPLHRFEHGLASQVLLLPGKDSLKHGN